jgi:hypothetical protein
MTTPLISITLPTFRAVVPFSAIGLLKRDFVGAAHDGSEPPAKRRKSIEAPEKDESVLSGAEPVELERVRHPGGVVEASDVRGDGRCEDGHALKPRPDPRVAVRRLRRG